MSNIRWPYKEGIQSNLNGEPVKPFNHTSCAYSRYSLGALIWLSGWYDSHHGYVYLSEEGDVRVNTQHKDLYTKTNRVLENMAERTTDVERKEAIYAEIERRKRARASGSTKNLRRNT